MGRSGFVMRIGLRGGAQGSQFVSNWERLAPINPTRIPFC
jgi:hypothetical protein